MKWVERVSDEELYLAMHYINSRYEEGLLNEDVRQQLEAWAQEIEQECEKRGCLMRLSYECECEGDLFYEN